MSDWLMKQKFKQKSYIDREKVLINEENNTNSVKVRKQIYSTFGYLNLWSFSIWELIQGRNVKF